MASSSEQRYIEGIGRRKTAVARVRITPSDKESVIVNERSVADYFETEELRRIAVEAIKDIELDQKFSISAKIIGGGIKSQAESLRLGTARALVKYNEELRKDLKKLGYLKRDPRVKERKKFGLKKARKSPQWSKR
jgi:small subunit ribosomal protein S9